VGGAIVIVLVVLGAINYLRPIPATSAAALLPTTDRVPGTAPALPWPAAGSAAVGVSGLGFIASSGNEQAIPAASVTKVMTALVALEDKPLKKGDDGPSVTITDADVQAYQSDLKDQQSVAKVEVGESLTEFQLLEGMLIPSANNFAETLARWDLGSTDAFVARMNAKAVAMHLTHTKFADVAGAAAGSVSTPTDLLILGMTAMQNEVFAQVVGREQADLPVAGTVINVNGELGKGGVIGIKTGSGLNSGANYLYAATATIDGHKITIYGCVMGQPTLAIAFSSAHILIDAMTAALHVRRVIARNQAIATFSTPWGDATDLIAQVDLDLSEWPGMIVRQRLDVKPIVFDHPVPAGAVVGSEHVVLGGYVEDIPILTADPMFAPGRVWRLTRLSF
jgi:D-alanyl-D-alanine carboxypeptidase (penicillin-binding protein 5/6)